MSAEQMELARLRAELARVKMERHPKKTVHFAWESVRSTPGLNSAKACWPGTLQCGVLNVSASSYFGHQRRKVTDLPETSGKHLSDAVLLVY
ncbi:MAG: hypothetical protein V9E86_06335 [Nitrosomonas sp.]